LERDLLLADDLQGAGAPPAFMDYPSLGGGYALLWHAARAGMLSHAYLLAGPRGVGKATFARALAAAQFCTGRAKPCGTCEGCQRVFAGGEPDVIEVLSPDDKPIPIERIRRTIGQISQHSFGGGRRVVIVEPAERMTPSAQNCLLKSLEEPPADVLFLLLAHEPGALLGTIASRCSVVRLSPWSDERLSAALERMGVAPVRIGTALPRAAGLIGRALRLLSDEEAQTDLTALVERMLGVSRDADAVALSTALKDDRGDAERTLGGLEQALETAMMVQSRLLPLSVVEGPALRAWCDNCPIGELTALARAVTDTRKRRQSQVNWQAGIDRLLMKIVEAKTRWQQS